MIHRTINKFALYDQINIPNDIPILDQIHRLMMQGTIKLFFFITR